MVSERTPARPEWSGLRAPDQAVYAGAALLTSFLPALMLSGFLFAPGDRLRRLTELSGNPGAKDRFGKLLESPPVGTYIPLG